MLTDTFKLMWGPLRVPRALQETHEILVLVWGMLRADCIYTQKPRNAKIYRNWVRGLQGKCADYMDKPRVTWQPPTPISNHLHTEIAAAERERPEAS